MLCRYWSSRCQGDCRLPHDSGEELPLTYLSALGALYYALPPSTPSSAAKVEDIAKTRNHANRDEITVSPDAMGAAYDEKIRLFYDEHIHEDEEIRYILKGTGYFDVRDQDDRWVRIRAEPGDLLILPAGIYHRFTVDEENVRLPLPTDLGSVVLLAIGWCWSSPVYQCHASLPDPAQVGGSEPQWGNGVEPVSQELRPGKGAEVSRVGLYQHSAPESWKRTGDSQGGRRKLTSFGCRI